MSRSAWHPAFVEVLQLELQDYYDDLQFLPENELTLGPLYADVVVIKTTPGLVIEKNIARHFRTHNVIEYKSPMANTTKKDFLKTLAYCVHYADRNKVNYDDITMTMVMCRLPKPLKTFLESKHGIVKTEQGIYTVNDTYFPAQIIVTSELFEDVNLWLNSLRTGLTKKKILRITSIAETQDKKILLYEFFRTLVNTNIKHYEEVFGMKGVFDRYLEESIEQGKRQEQSRSILSVLAARFKSVPKDVHKSIESYTDSIALDTLLQEAAICESMKDFRQALAR
jgi:hypothetical protein